MIAYPVLDLRVEKALNWQIENGDGIASGSLGTMTLWSFNSPAALMTLKNLRKFNHWMLDRIFSFT